MSKAAKARVDELTAQIHRSNEAYYLADAPLVSDAEWDRLFRELEELEREHPEYRHPESPTQRVGAAPLEAFQKISHRQPMLSISNSMDEEELRAFQDRVIKQLALKVGVDFLCE